MWNQKMCVCWEGYGYITEGCPTVARLAWPRISYQCVRGSLLFVLVFVCTIRFRVGRGPHEHSADLNRLWASPSKAAHPEIFHIKEHLQHLHEGGAVRAA